MGHAYGMALLKKVRSVRPGSRLYFDQIINSIAYLLSTKLLKYVIFNQQLTIRLSQNSDKIIYICVRFNSFKLLIKCMNNFRPPLL